MGSCNKWILRFHDFKGSSDCKLEIFGSRMRHEQMALVLVLLQVPHMFLLPFAQASGSHGTGSPDGGTQKLQEVSAASSSAYVGGEGIKVATASGTASTPEHKQGAAGVAGAAGEAGEAGAAGEAGIASGVAATGVATGTSTGTMIAGAVVSPAAGAVSLATSKSVGSGQIITALAATTNSEPGECGASSAVAGAASITADGVNVVLAGVTSTASSAVTSAVASSVSPDSSVSVVLASAAITTNVPPAEKTDGHVPPLVSTLKSDGYMSERDGSQKIPKTPAEVQKERKERTKKNRSSSRKSSRHHRTGEVHHRTGGDKSRKSSSHRSLSGRKTRDDKREKGQGNPRSRGHGSHKSASHSPTTRESRTAHKLGKSRSATTSSSLSKKTSKIGSFLRSFRAIPGSKTGVTSHDREVDIVAQTVEKHNIEAKVGKDQDGQELGITGTITSETKETIIFEAKSI